MDTLTIGTLLPRAVGGGGVAVGVAGVVGGGGETCHVVRAGCGGCGAAAAVAVAAVQVAAIAVATAISVAAAILAS